jgi:hypothetical protein
MTIILDMKTVVANARKAYDEGRLQAQQPMAKRGRPCTYSGGCAIGVSLTPKQAEYLDSRHDSTLKALLTNEKISIVNSLDDFNLGLVELQTLHDEWNSVVDRTMCDELLERKLKFLSHLESLEKEICIA